MEFHSAPIIPASTVGRQEYGRKVFADPERRRDPASWQKAVRPLRTQEGAAAAPMRSSLMSLHLKLPVVKGLWTFQWQRDKERSNGSKIPAAAT